MNKATSLVIAGGGTGGHLFPGIAVAEAMLSQMPDARILFVGTERGIESREVPKAGFEVAFIDIGGLKRVGFVKRIGTLLKLPISILAARKILREFGATAVLGVGGYASGPVVLAAKLMGLPTAICEQNSVPGMTNKYLGKWVRTVYASFAAAKAYFPSNKFLLVGNPVRASFVEAATGDSSSVEDDLVFVFGGSQGARPINQAMPQAIKTLLDGGTKVRVVHQTGKADFAATKEAYEKLGIDADVRVFIDDMVSMYRRAAVVLCRAGATSCAELTALGVPSILVPFPAATDDHQTMNAADLVKVGAARLLPQPELGRLAEEIAPFLGASTMRDDMAKAAKAAGRLDAADVVAEAATRGWGR